MAWLIIGSTNFIFLKQVSQIFIHHYINLIANYTVAFLKRLANRIFNLIQLLL